MVIVPKRKMKVKPPAPMTAKVLRKELHDGLCQNLTASLFFAENLRSQLRKSGTQDEALLRLADKVVEAAAQATIQMREILRKLGNEGEVGGEWSIARPDQD